MAESDRCECSHEREAHEHYRRGSDCGVCGAHACPRFRRAKAARTGRGPAPSAPDAASDAPAAPRAQPAREPVLRRVPGPAGTRRA